MELEKMLVWETRNYKKDFLNVAKNNDALVIFGAGIGGKLTFEILKEAGIDNRIIAFVDNDINKIGGGVLRCKCYFC